MTAAQMEIIKKALLDVDDLEVGKLRSLPDVPFDTSTNFMTNVDKLIECERKRESSILKLSNKKKVVALIASALILILTLTACMFRDEIREFFVKIHENNIEFNSDYEKNNSYLEYLFSYIPDKYELIESYDYSKSNKKVYSNRKEFLIVEQNSTESYSIRIDKNGSNYQTVVINGYTVYYTYIKNTYSLVWRNETNVFSITCHDSLAWDEIERIICGIVPLVE